MCSSIASIPRRYSKVSSKYSNQRSESSFLNMNPLTMTMTTLPAPSNTRRLAMIQEAKPSIGNRVSSRLRPAATPAGTHFSSAGRNVIVNNQAVVTPTATMLPSAR